MSDDSHVTCQSDAPGTGGSVADIFQLFSKFAQSRRALDRSSGHGILGAGAGLGIGPWAWAQSFGSGQSSCHGRRPCGRCRPHAILVGHGVGPWSQRRSRHTSHEHEMGAGHAIGVDHGMGPGAASAQVMGWAQAIGSAVSGHGIPRRSRHTRRAIGACNGTVAGHGMGAGHGVCAGAAIRIGHAPWPRDSRRSWGRALRRAQALGDRLRPWDRRGLCDPGWLWDRAMESAQVTGSAPWIGAGRGVSSGHGVDAGHGVGGCSCEPTSAMGLPHSAPEPLRSSPAQRLGPPPPRVFVGGLPAAASEPASVRRLLEAVGAVGDVWVRRLDRTAGVHEGSAARPHESQPSAQKGRGSEL